MHYTQKSCKDERVALRRRRALTPTEALVRGTMKLRTLCLYPCALLAALIASMIGFFSQAHIPEGRAFATIIPLANGYLPATIVGDEWWEARSPTPKVPSSLKPSARPSDESFLPLLGTKDQFPMLGLGLCCRGTAYDFHSVSRSVLWYLLKGGRHLDAAYLYMNNEAIGHGIAAAAARGIPRSELFVTSKLGPRFYSGDEPAVEVEEERDGSRLGEVEDRDVQHALPATQHVRQQPRGRGELLR